MKLSPRYDGPPLIAIDGPVDDQLAPVVRQRRRLEATLAGFNDDEWNAASRCDGWRVQDVVAHIVGVNTYWEASVKAGVAGEPLRILANFDPAATPKLMVGSMSSLTSEEVFQQFVSSNTGFLGALESLDATGWSMLAESPPGHVTIRVLASHALWDTWVHERDIALPLGRTQPVEDDEVIATLRYVAALAPALLIAGGEAPVGAYVVEVTDPELSFTLDVGESVTVRNGSAPDDPPLLRGDAVELIEALSIRAPLPDSTPAEWRELLRGLETVFDSAAR